MAEVTLVVQELKGDQDEDTINLSAPAGTLDAQVGTPLPGKLIEIVPGSLALLVIGVPGELEFPVTEVEGDEGDNINLVAQKSVIGEYEPGTEYLAQQYETSAGPVLVLTLQA